MDIDPSKSIEFIQKNAAVFAEAKSNRIHIENYLKYLKATLVNESNASTLGAKDTYAYSHPRYKDQLDAMKVAIETEERMKYLLEAAKLKIEVWKTQEYTKRTEMRM